MNLETENKRNGLQGRKVTKVCSPKLNSHKGLNQCLWLLAQTKGLHQEGFLVDMSINHLDERLTQSNCFFLGLIIK